ncbi:MAG: hypothetical protein JWP44_1727 [Mucilaginibacter sp.]|nr:hypothetical protein [Mucilaginibacter sp.]
MSTSERIRYYCFNKSCNSSIYFSDSCIILEVPLARAFGEPIYCQECFEELVSKPILELKAELGKLINAENSFNTILVDDDPAYHRIFKELFKNKGIFNEIKHYKDGLSALSYLLKNKNQAEFIPDLIFLDINMPEMDAWGFLDEFETLYPALGKKIGIYIISSQILPIHKHRLKLYKHVKGLINKPFDKKSLNDFLLEVSI